MTKFVVFLLLATPSCLLSQALPNKDINIYVSRASVFFPEDFQDFTQMDFANTRAIRIDGSEWQELKRGRGKTVYPDSLGTAEVWLRWRQMLDDRHWIVDYDWEWTAGSSTQSNIAQVFELRDGKAYLTQEIEADMHHGGHAVGAWFDAGKNTLTVKAVNYAPNEGRCCPSLMGVATFRWDGTKFRRISAKRVPLPKD